MKKRCILFFSVVVLFANSSNVSAQSFTAVSDALQQNQQLSKGHSFLIFPESRENSIHWFDSISNKRLNNIEHNNTFSITAQPGEYFVYQVGVWSLKTTISDVKVTFSQLKNSAGQIIATNKMTCFNTGGINFKGIPFIKKVDVAAGRIQAMWMGLDLRNFKTGIYTGTVSISSGKEKQTIPIELTISGSQIVNEGFNEGNRLARLSWLNSTVGIDNTITKGFMPIKVSGKIINILGRSFSIDPSGLPSVITSSFDANNQAILKQGAPLLDAPFNFVVQKEDGSIIKLNPGKLQFKLQSPAKVIWTVLSTSAELDIVCNGTIGFDGFVDYGVKLTAKMPLNIKDIRLEIPIKKEKAEYMMGLNQEGGFRTPDWKWKWDVTKNQDMLWLGAVNGGLRIKWKAENYKRPLVNIYYEFGPLKMPPSWDNKGNGGVDVTDKNNQVIVNAYSGKRTLKKGEVLHYDFELLITPFKTIDKNIKFEDRYYHGGGTNTAVKIDNAKKAGANLIVIHQAEDIYPFINYPYLDENTKALTDLVADAHKQNMRMKVYYTTRELTKNLPEFWALNSLNGEVIFPGPGNAARTEALHPNGPSKWLIDNMREKYIPAWYDTIKTGKFKGQIDLSVITTPDSRLNNFYIAGLDWMVEHMKIDGVYIDDAALDRFTLQRARKIIDRYRPQGRIDLHSWNHFSKWAGFASCLNLYMELLPYLDLVWIGEGRDYNRMPDHWLIEVSGIPFGLSGQMLEGGGNPWRGMVYGITTRAGWTINPPTEIWKFWDAHKLIDKKMIGYWDKESPVTCASAMVKATVYKSVDEVIISVANWTPQDITTTINIDWAKLGIDPTKYDISIPAIKDFQTEQQKVSLNNLIIPGKQGYLIVLKKKN